MGSESDLAIAAQALKGSPAEAIPAGSQVKTVNGVAVQSWDDVLRKLRKVQPGEAVEITAITPGSSTTTACPVPMQRPMQRC